MMAALKRVNAVMRARMLEFVRDRGSFGWNLLLPVLLVFGLALVFSGEPRPLYKVAVLDDSAQSSARHPFLDTPHIDFYPAESLSGAQADVSRHQTDMLIDLRHSPGRYWINPTSGKGELLERLLLQTDPELQRQTITGKPIRYVDWVVPGVIGMNMMFSAMYGVGYVLVRYRKNGYLKRLHATPLSAFEFLCAQILSRLVIIIVLSAAIFFGTGLVLEFRMEGSHFALLLLSAVGAVSLIALGLIIAARVESEEFAEGLLNAIAWPMMVLSGVWFSLEGSHPALHWAAQLLPLTHILDGARAIMLEGAGLSGILPQLAALAVMSALFLSISAAIFRWERK